MNEVNAVLAANWDGALPVDPVKIARRMGVTVVRHQFSDDTVCETGIVNGVKTIRVGATVERMRMRFAVAHALAHCVLHADQLPQLPPSQGDLEQPER